MPWHPLCFSVMLLINFLNCFLAGATCVFAECKTFLGNVFLKVFKAGTGVSILDVLGLNSYLGVRYSLRRYGLIFANQLLDCRGVCFTWNTFHKWKKLDFRDPISFWFVLVINFIKNGGLNNSIHAVFCPALTKFACDIGFISGHLLVFKHHSVEVYTNGFVRDLGSIGACGGAAAYFPEANTSINVKVLSLLSSTLVELQTIALVLECVPVSSSVILFTDSQALLDICKFDMGLSGPDFCYKCWIEREHIHQVISEKNLLVTWNKIKGHSGIMKNEHADFFANVTTFSEIILPLKVPYCFFCVKNRPMSGNAHHFIKNLFDAVNFIS
ncbi:hypothetical protein G9A89_005898 [Geosiphon pyriformis]|nr:hypothetical protein G9A89_005898 [Geosiphon pyriformis]